MLPHALLALSNDLIDTYSNYVPVYTDASKTDDGKVGVGCYFEPTRDSTELKLVHRITDHVSIYAGEMAAIRLAIQTAGQLNCTAPVVIFSDSLSAVRSLELEWCKSRPNLLRDIIESKHALNWDVTLVWVPSHIGIHGNETADNLAAEGTRKASVDIDIGHKLAEAYSAVDHYCRQKWQGQWSLRTHCQYFHIEPKVCMYVCMYVYLIIAKLAK